MKYVINKQKGKAYIQIYEQIKNDIVNGTYKYNAKLPSKRLLAEETEVSVITIEHAYSLLYEEGYINTRERSGYFVSYSSDNIFASPTPQISSVVNHQHATENDCEFPFSVYAKTVRRILINNGEDIFASSDGSGSIELKTAIRDYLKRSRGITVTTDQIVIGAGSEYLYGLIVQLLGKNRIYALEDPSYPKIAKIYRSNGVKTLLLPLLKNGISSEHLQKTPATVLHITPYRSFPSRVSATASKKSEYIRWAKTRDNIIIEDDFESEFTLLKKAEETVFSLSGGSNVIYVNTFTKTISPAVRVAYMLLPQNMVETYKNNLGFYSCSVPLLNQLVLAELISNGDFERHINRERRKRRRSQ